MAHKMTFKDVEEVVLKKLQKEVFPQTEQSLIDGRAQGH
jgi:hypothetical protein